MKTISKNVAKKTVAVALVLLALVPIILYLSRYVVLLNIYGPDTPRDPISMIDFYPLGNYKIDAGTILKSIDSAQSPIFLPETVQIPDSNTNGNLKWNQSEFLKVVESLFEFQWKESLSKDWSVHRMIFVRDCEENPVGFDYASFVFHRLVVLDGKSKYEVRIIEISLPDEIVSWGGSVHYVRPFFGTSEFDLDNLKITADDALRIAEEHGGKASRQSEQNKCQVSATLDVNWRVTYSPSSFFEIYIDPYIGIIGGFW